MNNKMKTKNCFDALIKNFRFTEAEGFISALICAGDLASDYSENYAQLLHDYKNIVYNCLWNNERLSPLKYSDSFVKNESKRLSKIVEKWLNVENAILLTYVSLYAAVVNQDTLRFKLYSNKIIQKLNQQNVMLENECLGGYDQFEQISNALGKYLRLEDPLFRTIEELHIRISLFEDLLQS